MPLVWRSTFIHLEEHGSEFQAGLRLSRAHSEPSLCELGEDVFAHEKLYVSELSEKFTRCAEGFRQRCREVAQAPDARAMQPLAAEAEFAAKNSILSSLLLRARVEAEGECGQDETVEGETRAPSRMSDHSPATTTSARFFCNTGSIGHPDLCFRPCLYFAANQCVNGASCEFCHMTHTKRASHLNKQHREQLRDMDDDRVRALILPMVRAKAAAFDAAENTTRAVDRLALACGVAESRRLRLSRDERSLKVALKGMNLRLLLITLQRAALQAEPAAIAAADALLTQLRRVA
mmetsp:Transcript_33257/g.66024  ORF Transcript_33257/g.66024 Transcript_33257/m.66024 type:complete len:292 (+) Transcript_33257:30-905(+)